MAPHPIPLPCALTFPPPSHRDATTPSPCWAPHFITQERIMFLNPTPSKPRLSPAARMSDDTLSALILKINHHHWWWSVDSGFPERLHWRTNCHLKPSSDKICWGKRSCTPYVCWGKRLHLIFSKRKPALTCSAALTSKISSSRCKLGYIASKGALVM